MKFSVLILVCAAMFNTASYAAIVSHSPGFQIVNAPASLANGVFEANGSARIIIEGQNVLLGSDLDVDIITPGFYNGPSTLSPGSIAAGTRVDSYLIHYDPVSDRSRINFSDIVFDRQILGIIAPSNSLQAIADSVVGLTGVTYDNSISRRTEVGVALSTDDELVLDAGLFSISDIVLQTTGALDEFRVITVSSVPVPVAVWLFASGLLGLIGISRR